MTYFFLICVFGRKRFPDPILQGDWESQYTARDGELEQGVTDA